MFKRAVAQLICLLIFIACITGPVLASHEGRSDDNPLTGASSVAQLADECYEAADAKSAAQSIRWSSKSEFLSRSLVAVLLQRNLCMITHPAGMLRREFSQPSLFALGIALRL